MTTTELPDFKASGYAVSTTHHTFRGHAVLSADGGTVNVTDGRGRTHYVPVGKVRKVRELGRWERS